MQGILAGAQLQVVNSAHVHKYASQSQVFEIRAQNPSGNKHVTREECQLQVYSVSVLPKRCGTLSWKLSAPWREGMAWKTIGVCYIFKLGTFGGGRLSGWFTTREGWMRLSGVVLLEGEGGGVIL